MVPSPTVCEVVSPSSDVSLSDDECEVIVSYGSLSDGDVLILRPEVLFRGFPRRR